MMLRLLVSAVICLYCLSQAEETPEIVEITNDQALNTGDSVEVSCSVRNSQDYPVMWQKVDPDRPGDGPIFISKGPTTLIPDSRFSLSSTPNRSISTYKLQISNIQRSDAGIYKCVISLSTNNSISKEVKLDVYSPPLIHHNSGLMMVVKELDPVIMMCSTGGTPEPLTWWKREDNAILPTGGTVYRGNVLKINSVKQEYGGTYLCTADNGVGEAAKSRIFLKVVKRIESV
ncbi:hypothetical protein V9T40_012240 [Parthenolecanium corni]|uniref:Ig-like domain-containing protein n=1 Tax=Parthenolecanium corni TaxID=536013 RepID=A0AAN9TAC2_9HEMI